MRAAGVCHFTPQRRHPAAPGSAAVFAIDLDPLDPARGEIRIGGFVEGFELRLGWWSAQDYRRSWRQALQRLVACERSAVGLLTWRGEPSDRCTQRAWILFREGDRVFVQERLFVGGEHPVDFDTDGQIVVREPRRERGADGERISQWETDLGSVARFLART